jgi:hypothetical protein
MFAGGTTGGAAAAVADGAVAGPRRTNWMTWSRTSGSMVLSWFFTSMPCWRHRASKSLLSMSSSRASAKMRIFS